MEARRNSGHEFYGSTRIKEENLFLISANPRESAAQELRSFSAVRVSVNGRYAGISSNAG